MVALGGGAVSYERGTPVDGAPPPLEERDLGNLLLLYYSQA